MNISNYYRNSLGIYQQQYGMNPQSEKLDQKKTSMYEDAGQAKENTEQLQVQNGSMNQDNEISDNTISKKTVEQNYIKDPVFKLYQEISDQFSDVSFRLDDREEATKYQAVNGVNCCPYLGYQNSMNQIGEYFGEKDQKSMELDASVIKKSLDNEDYRKKLFSEIDAQIKDYEIWKSKAEEHGVSYFCISLSDQNDEVQVSANFSNYPFSTEDQLKAVWSEQASIERLMCQSEKMRNLLFGE